MRSDIRLKDIRAQFFCNAVWRDGRGGTLSECGEGGVEAVQRKTHHVVEAAANAADSGTAYPLLYAVSSGFVERAVVMSVEAYFIVGKWSKIHFGDSLERLGAGGC